MPFLLLILVLLLSVPSSAFGDSSSAAPQDLGPLADVARPDSALDSSSQRLADFDGRWRQVPSGVDEQNRLKAIDTAVEPLTWVIRKMAGGVLRSTTAPKSELLFVWDGARLRERVNGAHGDETRLIEPGAGTMHAVDSRGEPFDGTWIWTPEGLRFSWRQHQAYGANLYRLDEARRELTIDHAIHVTGINGVRPILYRSRFQKDALPAVSAAGGNAER